MLSECVGQPRWEGTRGWLAQLGDSGIKLRGPWSRGTNDSGNQGATLGISLIAGQGGDNLFRRPLLKVLHEAHGSET